MALADLKRRTAIARSPDGSRPENLLVRNLLYLDFIPGWPDSTAEAGARMRVSTMDKREKNLIVAVFDSHAAAEEAVKALEHAGFNMKQLSIVGKDYHSEEHVVGYYTTGDRMWYWGKFGAFWGGLWGLLFGAAFFLVPGIGPVLVAGPLVSAIVSGLEGAAVVGGIGVIGAGLYSIGIPRNSVLDYERALRADKYLLVAHGTVDEVTKAKEIMDTVEATEAEIHGG